MVCGSRETFELRAVVLLRTPYYVLRTLQPINAQKLKVPIFSNISGSPKLPRLARQNLIPFYISRAFKTYESLKRSRALVCLLPPGNVSLHLNKKQHKGQSALLNGPQLEATSLAGRLTADRFTLPARPSNATEYQLKTTQQQESWVNQPVHPGVCLKPIVDDGGQGDLRCLSSS